MNSISPNIQAPSPQTQNPLRAENGDSASAPGPSQGFTAAMDNASAKPARKAAATKTSNGDIGGKPLPAAGNQAPPVTTAAPQATPSNPSSSPLPGSTITTTTATTTATPVSATATPTTSGAPVPGETPAASGDNTTATIAPAAQAVAEALSGSGAAAPRSPTDADIGNAQSRGTQSSAVQSAASSDAAAQTAAAQPGTVQLGAAQVRGAQPGSAAATASSAVADKLPVGPVTGNRPVATMKSNVVAAAGTDPAANTNTAQSDLSAVAASNDAGSVQTGADATATAMAATTSGVVTQNSVSSADSAASAATGTPIGADAATVADATAAATAAVAASATRVITELASTTATDKRLRGGDAVSGAASTAGADGTTGVAQAMSGASSTPNTDAAASPTFKVGANVDSNEFGQNVANQVAAMVGSKISNARLSVNPPSLGPIEVRISVQGDQAQVSMMSHSAVTRDALQDSSPKLREMLNSQGFAQVSVDISQRSFQERTPSPQTYEWNSGTDRSDYATSVATTSSVTRTANGALDAYA